MLLQKRVERTQLDIYVFFLLIHLYHLFYFQGQLCSYITSVRGILRVGVILFLVFCVLFNFFVIFLLAIVLPVLRFTPFNYHFGIFIWSRGSIIHNYNGYVKWWWSTIYIIILCSNYVISLPGLNEIVLRMYNHQQCADSCWREWTCFTISSKTTIYIYLFDKKIIVDKLLFTCCYCRK